MTSTVRDLSRYIIFGSMLRRWNVDGASNGNNKNGTILSSYLLDFDNFGTKWYLRFKFYQCVWFLGRWRVDGTLMVSQTSLCESLNLKMIQNAFPVRFSRGIHFSHLWSRVNTFGTKMYMFISRRH